MVLPRHVLKFHCTIFTIEPGICRFLVPFISFYQSWELFIGKSWGSKYNIQKDEPSGPEYLLWLYCAYKTFYILIFGRRERLQDSMM